MFIRPCLDSFLWRTDSFDYGQTWTAAARTDIPTSGSKIATFKINGRILLINNTDAQLWVRRRLDLWMSDDNAATWSTKIPLAHIPDGSVAYHVGYPHGFTDDARQTLYLAIDCIKHFELLKIPYADLF